MLHDKDQLIQSVPGVGPNTSRMLLAALPELGGLGGRQIASLVGVAPFNRDSGKMRGKRMVSGGRNRRAQPSIHGCFSGFSSQQYNQGVLFRLRKSGKKGNVALVACIRKLVVILNAMLKKKQPFCELNA